MGRIRVDLTGIISANESYYVKVDEGFVVDSVTATPNTAITNTTDIAFTTDPAPLLSTSYPLDNATDYGFEQPALITISFPQAITINTGNVRVYKYSDDTLIDTIAVTNGWLSGNDLKIETLSTLDPAVTYYVLYDAGIVQDAANCFNCPAETNKDNAHTISITPSPTANASKVSLEFPESITIQTGNVYLKKDSDDSTVEIFDVATDATLTGGNTLDFYPSIALLDDTVAYYLITDAGIVNDSNGFAFCGITTKGNYEGTTPTFTYSGFTGTLRLDFDQLVYAGTGNITLKRTADDSTVTTYDVTTDVTFARKTASMSATLYSGQGYYLLIDNTAIVDGIGEAYAGLAAKTDLNFTLVTGPVYLSSVDPADNTIDFDTFIDGFTLTFSENVTANTGNIYIKAYTGDTVMDTLDITSEVTIVNDTVTFNSNEFYQSNTQYYVATDSGVLENASGVNWGGITDKDRMNFTTGYVSWDLDDAAYASKSFVSNAQETTPRGIELSDDGTKMYLVGPTNDTVYQYTLSTAWDISTASYATKSFSVSTQMTTPYDVKLSLDGTKMYVLDADGDVVYQYTLSTAWDISTASYATKSFSVATEETATRGFFINSAGTKMYVIGELNDAVYQYTLSTAWDISTASYDSKSKSVSTQTTLPQSVALSANGKRMYVSEAAAGTNEIYQYTLSTAWDISTASYDLTINVASEAGTGFNGIVFRREGGRMYGLTSGGTPTSFQYNL